MTYEQVKLSPFEFQALCVVKCVSFLLSYRGCLQQVGLVHI